MSIEVHSSNDGRYVIKVSGRFGIEHHLDFVRAYESIEGNKATLDFSETVYLDSAALGMMLAMREHLGGERAMIDIINCTNQIKDILKIAHFSRLFSVR